MNNVDGSDKDDNEEKEEEATSGEDDKAEFSGDYQSVESMLHWAIHCLSHAFMNRFSCWRVKYSLWCPMCRAYLHQT
jgi:hypothetical protein